MTRAAIYLITLLLLSLSTQALATAVSSNSVPASPIAYSQDQIRQLGFEIARELRCPMAINQNLFDSQSQIANELKGQIFLMLDEGHAKSEIIDFMVQRYGEKIRYMPSLSGGTSVLWFAPLLFVVIAISSVVYITRRRSKLESSPSSPDKATHG